MRNPGLTLLFMLNRAVNASNAPKNSLIGKLKIISLYSIYSILVQGDNPLRFLVKLYYKTITAD